MYILLIHSKNETDVQHFFSFLMMSWRWILQDGEPFERFKLHDISNRGLFKKGKIRAVWLKDLMNSIKLLKMKSGLAERETASSSAGCSLV